ncbi:glutaredoxin [Alteromonadaceae bacterium M269]|nr:glutaredoxin [Alteromonadaceae bacterium M269]
MSVTSLSELTDIIKVFCVIIDFFKRLLGLKSEPVVPKQQVYNLSLYYFTSCPFCRTVIRRMKHLNIEFPMRNINADDRYREELVKNGGKQTVPCLRIEKQNGEIQWMYESMDIIAYLDKRFSESSK